jgi:hypothetical protein
MELEHLRIAGELMKRHDGRDPREVTGGPLPEPVMFEPNKSYVREILATQIDLRADGATYVPDADLPADHRSRRYRDVVNAGGVPTEQVIEQNRAAAGREFRDETEGEHPVPDLRAPAST